MMRRNSFREKGPRHEKTHCNISVRGWREEEWEKA